MSIRHFSLYEALDFFNIINKAELNQALAISKKQSKSLFQVILDQNFSEESTLLNFIGNQLDIPYQKLEENIVDKNIAQRIPESFARQHLILPLFEIEDQLTIAISNPFNTYALEELTLLTSHKLNYILSNKNDIYQFINHCYCYSTNAKQEDLSSIKLLINNCDNIINQSNTKKNYEFQIINNSTFISLFDHIFEQFFFQKADAIHFEITNQNTEISFQKKNSFMPFLTLPKSFSFIITTKLKCESNLINSSQKTNQKGSFSYTYNNISFEFFIFILQTTNGEKTILKHKRKTHLITSINKLGLSKPLLSSFLELLNKKNGILIFCGIKNTGKSSTIYSALNYLTSIDKKVYTIENPVKYDLEGANQTEINKNYSYTTGLKAIIEHAPHTIMIDNISNQDVLNLSIQIALSGKQVLTPINSADITAALIQLYSKNINKDILNKGLMGIVCQRLIETLCPNCKEKKESLSKKELTYLKTFNYSLANTSYEAKGCIACSNSGFKGYIGLFEILTFTDEVRKKLNTCNTQDISSIVQEHLQNSISHDGLEKVNLGMISLNSLIENKSQ